MKKITCEYCFEPIAKKRKNGAWRLVGTYSHFDLVISQEAFERVFGNQEDICPMCARCWAREDNLLKFRKDYNAAISL